MSRDPMEEMRFLGKLVQRGVLSKEQAEAALAAARGGSPLEALVEQGVLDRERLARLQKLQGEEVPDLPGHEMLGLAGKGGTAVVVRVRERKSGAERALKVLLQELQDLPEARKAFLKEARLLCELEHENLVKGYKAGTFEGRLIFLMEWIEGRSLLDMLRDGHSFDEEQALYIILQAARGLRYLSSRGVVHRDIKPDNILLTSDNQVKIIDLGYAATEAGGDGDTTVGTVAYISPEQARGQGDLDVRADIYSLGATLYQLVVGELPFAGDDDRDVLAAQILASLSSEKLKSRNISPHLHYFLEKMMAKEREVRYQNPDELIADIEEQIAGYKSAQFDPGAAKGRDLRPKAPESAPNPPPKKFPEVRRRRRR